MSLPGSLDCPFHISIASPDIDDLMATLGRAFDLTWVALPRPPVLHDTPQGPVRPSSRAVWSSQGPLHIELVQAEAGTIYSPELGTRVHHVGYWVDDLAEAIAELEARGWAMAMTKLDDEGRPSVFAFASYPGKLWVELVDVARRADLEAILTTGST